MDVLGRGIQGYLLIVGGIGFFALVWGANLFLFQNTTAETGWPLLIGAAIAITLLLVGLYRLFAASDDTEAYHREAEPYDWESRN